MVELFLVDFLLGALGDDSTRAYIVKITQELSCILLQLISVDIHQSLARLLFKTYIIIIGGSDNVELALGIDQPVVFAVGQQMLLFVDTAHAAQCTFTMVVELFVLRLTLTEPHELYVGNEKFYLIVGDFGNLSQLLVGTFEIHPNGGHKSQIVERLGSAGIVSFRQVESTVGINLCGV